MDHQYYLSKLKQAGVRFERGLTDSEVRRAETTYGVQFPEDLRDFLQRALPVSDRWPNWRDRDNEFIRGMLAWPMDGVCFAIRSDEFWWGEWAEKPDSLEEAQAVARREMAKAPRLMPIVGHRYLPCDPPTAGNPVLSVHQTDIICYGADLWEFFENQFPSYFDRSQWSVRESARPVPFWSMLG